MAYQFNSYVNRQEADALKEMIFKRARERANSMTGDVQVDVMNIARESFENNHNPFAQIIGHVSESSSELNKEEISKINETSLSSYTDAIENRENEIGFPQKNLFTGISAQNQIIKEQLTTSQIQNNMIEAREVLSNKKSFMGALAFLNSQAAVSLLNKRAGKGIDMVV